MHEIKLPTGGVAFHMGGRESGEREQKIVNARGKFCLEYMAKKGWGSDPLGITLDQLFEIRKQEEWKNPLGSEAR